MTDRLALTLALILAVALGADFYWQGGARQSVPGPKINEVARLGYVLALTVGFG